MEGDNLPTSPYHTGVEIRRGPRGTEDVTDNAQTFVDPELVEELRLASSPLRQHRIPTQLKTQLLAAAYVSAVQRPRPCVAGNSFYRRMC